MPRCLPSWQARSRSHFESPVRSKMQSMENLVAYRDRMMTEYFPEFAKELNK